MQLSEVGAPAAPAWPTGPAGRGGPATLGFVRATSQLTPAGCCTVSEAAFAQRLPSAPKLRPTP
eukprot:10517290-Alexandrium_andersonii.AAC.1